MDMEEQTQEQQIWQRVLTGREAPPRSDLRQMQLQSLELAGIYRYLAQHRTGKQQERARELYEAEMGTALCLKGLGILSGRQEDVLTPWHPIKAPGRKLLEKCYHQTRRCMVDYAARSAEPEFGCVFHTLAQQAEDRCTRITQLLGSIG